MFAVSLCGRKQTGRKEGSTARTTMGDFYPFQKQVHECAPCSVSVFGTGKRLIGLSDLIVAAVTPYQLQLCAVIRSSEGNLSRHYHTYCNKNKCNVLKVEFYLPHVTLRGAQLIRYPVQKIHLHCKRAKCRPSSYNCLVRTLMVFPR